MAPIAKEIGSALITGGAGLIGGLINAHAQAQANKTQMKIAQMNNDYNYRMFKEQNDWNLSQWERENEYNTPAAQRQRFEQAGINPYMALGNMSSGNAQGVVQSAQATPAVTPQIRPVTGFGDSVNIAAQNAISAFSASANAEKTLREAKAVDIDNQTRLAENIARLRKIGAEYEANVLSNEFNRYTFQQRASAIDASIEQVTNSAKLMYEQAQQQRLQNEITETFGKTLAAKQVDLLVSQIDKFKAEAESTRGLLPYQQALMVAQKVQNYASAHKMYVESWQIQQLTDDLESYYGNAGFEARQRGLDVQQDRVQHWLNQTNWYKSPSELQFERYIQEKGLANMITPKDVLNVISFGILGKGASKLRGKSSNKPVTPSRPPSNKSRWSKFKNFFGYE